MSSEAQAHPTPLAVHRVDRAERKNPEPGFAYLGDESGRTWLGAPPLLTMAEGGDEREPMQLTWARQRALLLLLPDHLA